MAEPIRYVVVCACTGELRPLALLDDDRAAGGPVTLRPAQTATKQMFIGTTLLDGSSAHDHIARQWATKEFSQNGSGWTIRCGYCGPDQAQINQRTLPRIVDRLAAMLAATPDEFPRVPVSDHERRHIVRLGVLVRALARKLR